MVDGNSSLSFAAPSGPTSAAMSWSLPSSAYASTAVGCASAAMSGGLPPSIRVLSTVSWLEPMLSTWTAMPVAVWKSLMALAKPSPSPAIHCVWIETFLPVSGLSAPSAWSSSV